MGLLSGLFKKNRIKAYDLDSLEGINAIPVPISEDISSDDRPMYYRLQRKATEHKKNGNMDMAIACLWKSIHLSDFAFQKSGHILLTKDEYYRVAKYLHASGDLKGEQQAYEYIDKCHPEFSDRRISSKQRLQQTLQTCAESKCDFVRVFTRPSCPVCGKYDKKTFSLSGKSNVYPQIPEVFLRDGGLCKNCSISILPDFEALLKNKDNLNR